METTLRFYLTPEERLSSRKQRTMNAVYDVGKTETCTVSRNSDVDISTGVSSRNKK
jgi:hypothetical protein